MGFVTSLVRGSAGGQGASLGAARRRTAEGTVDEGSWGWSLYSTPSITGLSINQVTALNSTAVLACVTMLAEDVAKVEPVLYTRDAKGVRTRADQHPLAKLFVRPNDWQNWLEFAEMLQLAVELRGNGYAVIRRDGATARPTALIPVNPDWVALWEGPSGEIFYRVTPTGLHLRAELAGEPFMIPAEDMFHLRGFSLNGLVGSSRIHLGREAIALSLGYEQTSARWTGNSTNPSGVLTTEGKLTAEAAKRIAEDWKQMNSGLSKVGRVAVLEQGLKFEPIAMKAADLDFIASRKFQLEEIARLWRVPLYMLGVTQGANQFNVAQQAQEYHNYTLSGRLIRWKRKLAQTFGLDRERLFVDYDMSILLEADITTRIANHRIKIMSGIESRDEARMDLGLAPRGGRADELSIPVNMADAGSDLSGTAADEAGRPKKGETK